MIREFLVCDFKGMGRNVKVIDESKVYTIVLVLFICVLIVSNINCAAAGA